MLSLEFNGKHFKLFPENSSAFAMTWLTGLPRVNNGGSPLFSSAQVSMQEMEGNTTSELLAVLFSCLKLYFAQM